MSCSPESPPTPETADAHSATAERIAAGLGIGVLPPSPVRVSGTIEIKLSQPRTVRPLRIGWIEERYLRSGHPYVPKLYQLQLTEREGR